MLRKRSGLLVGVKLVPVLCRKDAFEADIGPFVNDRPKYGNNLVTIRWDSCGYQLSGLVYLHNPILCVRG